MGDVGWSWQPVSWLVVFEWLTWVSLGGVGRLVSRSGCLRVVDVGGMGGRC